MAVGVVAVLAVVVLIAVSGNLAGGPAATPPRNLRVGGAPSPGSSTQTAPRRTPEGGTRAPASELPASRGPAPTREPIGPTNSPSPQPTPTLAGGAPTGPAEFDLEEQQITIGFPLRPDTRYHYRNNFLDTREGSPDDYNHARRHEDGTATRLHDGIDIYARHGAPLIAPFDGMVIDARTRWQPWEPARYGNTVVIVSEEAVSAGYVALFVHMDEVWVDPGTHVTRGQVIGAVGRTGNAEAQSVRPHLHFELRAPFLLDWSALGEDRAVDAFNPYPSLVAADPKRT